MSRRYSISCRTLTTRGAAVDGSFATAANLNSLINPTALTALVPSLNLNTVAQAEYFTFNAPSGTTGTLKLNVQSSGLSLLAPNVTVYASNQTTVLGSASGAGSVRDDAHGEPLRRVLRRAVLRQGARSRHDGFQHGQLRHDAQLRQQRLPDRPPAARPPRLMATRSPGGGGEADSIPGIGHPALTASTGPSPSTRSATTPIMAITTPTGSSGGCPFLPTDESGGFSARSGKMSRGVGDRVLDQPECRSAQADQQSESGDCVASIAWWRASCLASSTP